MSLAYHRISLIIYPNIIEKSPKYEVNIPKIMKDLNCIILIHPVRTPILTLVSIKSEESFLIYSMKFKKEERGIKELEAVQNYTLHAK